MSLVFLVAVVQSSGSSSRSATSSSSYTDGSRSLRHFLQPMRECGAACRLMLEMAAEKLWNDPHRLDHLTVGLGHADAVAALSAGYGSATVTAQDAAGNTVTAFTGSQALTFSGPANSPNATA